MHDGGSDYGLFSHRYVDASGVLSPRVGEGASSGLNSPQNGRLGLLKWAH